MAIDFNGATDRLDYTSGIGDISGFTNLTVACRVYRDAGSGVSEYILNWESSGVVRHLLWWRSDGKLQWLIAGSTTGMTQTADGAELIDDVWNDVILVHSPMSLTASNAKIYVNGSDVSFVDSNGSGTVVSVNEFRIGGRTADDNRNADIKIADVVIADAAWDAGERAAYGAGRRSGESFTRGRTNYMPLVRSIHDVVGGDPGSADGTVAFPHPPIIMPTPAQTAFIAAVPAVGRIMGSLAGLGGLAGHGGIAGKGGGLAA